MGAKLKSRKYHEESNSSPVPITMPVVAPGDKVSTPSTRMIGHQPRSSNTLVPQGVNPPPNSTLPSNPVEIPSGPPKLTKEHQAGIVRRLMVPAAMMESGAFSSSVTTEGYFTFVEELLKDAGDPTDPLERMLIEQLALCHVRLATLYGKAADTKTIDAAAVYNSMCIRLAAEFRKLTLAVEQYRTARQARLTGGKDAEATDNSRRRTGK